MQITKKVDILGRIVLPKSYREQLKINTHDKIMICTVNKDIYAYKVQDKLMSIDKQILLGELVIIDELGRLVLPKCSIRNVLNIHAGDSLSLEITVDNIIKITKARISCDLCGRSDNLYSFKNKHLCEECIESINQIFNTKRTNAKSI